MAMSSAVGAKPPPARSAARASCSVARTACVETARPKRSSRLAAAGVFRTKSTEGRSHRRADLTPYGPMRNPHVSSIHPGAAGPSEEGCSCHRAHDRGRACGRWRRKQHTSGAAATRTLPALGVVPMPRCHAVHFDKAEADRIDNPDCTKSTGRLRLPLALCLFLNADQRAYAQRDGFPRTELRCGLRASPFRSSPRHAS
jgi:hypothetical protein